MRTIEADDDEVHARGSSSRSRLKKEAAAGDKAELPGKKPRLAAASDTDSDSEGEQDVDVGGASEPVSDQDLTRCPRDLHSLSWLELLAGGAFLGARPVARKVLGSNYDMRKQVEDFPYISRVNLKNFMCHSNFTTEFIPEINFIGGENGTGKSSVLTAIAFGLGARAEETGRGSNVRLEQHCVVLAVRNACQCAE